MTDSNSGTAGGKAPLQWTGVLFAFAATTMLVSVTDRIVRTLALGVEWETLATLVAPAIAGVATAYYVTARGAIHALLGALISVPVLALFIFGGAWQPAIFAGCFSIIAAAISEILRRRLAPAQGRDEHPSPGRRR